MQTSAYIIPERLQNLAYRFIPQPEQRGNGLSLGKLRSYSLNARVLKGQRHNKSRTNANPTEIRSGLRSDGSFYLARENQRGERE